MVVVVVHFLLKMLILLMLSDDFLAFLNWCGKNPGLGAFLYALIFSVGAVLCLPEIALAAVSGYLFPYYLAFFATWKWPARYLTWCKRGIRRLFYFRNVSRNVSLFCWFLRSE